MRLRLDPLSLIVSLAIIGGTTLFIRDVAALLLVLGVEVLTCITLVREFRAAASRMALPALGILGVVWVNWLATSSTQAAVSSGLRVAAVVLPGVVLLPMIDATALADGLAQRWHLPARVVLPVLAAVRLLESLRIEWKTIQSARRLRGIAAETIGERVRQFPGLVFSLLVQALRRADRLSVAMQTRGIERPGRTWARASVLRIPDRALLLGSIALSGLALFISR
jgi:energy-coupling factor transporter transmembrane protein EcfT